MAGKYDNHVLEPKRVSKELEEGVNLFIIELSKLS